ncbi:MAG: hypothetical protein Dasosvirus3_14 [Dasosvirus sp.]|uniref:Uncharacterized protein n=1 Tax=Dasosvirus sp. TaxID=2487764 RepID=A0A3G4ZRG2_9VIRU|nr:MAG: hypothetical protein Dasosvirus3_14 [Dasosvirus sp.]
MNSAIVSLVALNTGINVTSHSGYFWSWVENMWNKLWYYSNKIMKSKNEPIYRILTEIISKYATGLNYKELITLQYKWDDHKEAYYKSFWIPEIGTYLSVSNGKETIKICRIVEFGDEGYVLYCTSNVTMQRFLKQVFKKVNMPLTDLHNLLPMILVDIVQRTRRNSDEHQEHIALL